MSETKIVIDKLPPTIVVNIRKEPFDVYIGRAGHGYDGYFGNPFHDKDRTQNIARFREYFYRRLKDDKAFSLRVHALRGKRLGCFCKPAPCHGDVIVEYLNSLGSLPSIKLAVVGSRSFTNYSFLKEILDWHRVTQTIKQIISGGAKGADSLAKRYAEEHDIQLVEYLPDWERYGKSAGYRRNKQILQAADEVVAFWDGTSKGTKHSIALGTELGKPVYIYKYECDNQDDITHLGL